MQFESPQSNEREELIRQYQEKYLPENMRTQKKVNLVVAAGLEAFFARQAAIEGRENLPEKGPFIVVSNHFNLKESSILLALLKDFDAHIVASKNIHGEHPIGKHGLKAIRALTVPNSLSHLSSEEKQELLERTPDGFVTDKYREIIEREEVGHVDRAGLVKFIRSSTALLSRGDVIVIYPEGLWLYDGEDGEPRSQSLYQGYDGFSFIAEEYEKLTGEEVPIIPVGFFKENREKHVKIGQPSTLSENDTELSPADFYMQQIAASLPEDQRGYYKDESKE